MNLQKTKAFTLVELIVVITILAILWTIAFVSLQWYSAISRDSVRISDVSKMKKSLELFHLDAGKYPLPDNYEEVTYSWDILRYQWILWKNVVTNLSRNLTEIPKDPLSNLEYVFSTSWTKNEFELLSLLEWDLAINTISQTNAATVEVTPKIDWQYNGLFVKTPNYIVPVPSIISSEIIPTWWMVLDDTNIKSQIVDGWSNIPSLWNVTQVTEDLDITLSVYDWPAITSNSTPAQKTAVLDAIKTAYSWSTLASTDIYNTLLTSTTEDEIISFVDIVVLNTATPVVEVVITDADCAA